HTIEGSKEHEGHIIVTLRRTDDAGVVLVVHGTSDEVRAITAAFPASGQQSMAIGLSSAAHVLENAGPWTANEIIEWFIAEAKALDAEEEIAPQFRDGYRLGMANLLGSVMFHMKRGTPQEE